MLNKASPHIGEDMHAFMRTLYPICSSITGNGLRERLRLIQERIPITIHEVPTGTRVFDWTVPKEWNVRAASIHNSRGETIVDILQSNLHVLNYSVPVRATMGLAELKEHLFSLPEHPDWIPYRTSYYEEQWGFCMTHRQVQALEEDQYDVLIDSTLEDGALSFGELYLPGQTDEEVLLSTYACHPSLCNDNLSGVVLLTALVAALQTWPRRYSYRCLFLPETIGSLAWLALHEKDVQTVKHGLVITCVGDIGPLTYKRSRRGSAEIDRVVEKVLKDIGCPHTVLDFFPSGSDERQYCSPGFNLSVGSLMRTPYGRFPEYHTSADNLDFCQPDALCDSFEVYKTVLQTLEQNDRYLNVVSNGEPQLGTRGLYEVGGAKHMDRSKLLDVILWVLNLSDGNHSLLDIAMRSGMSFSDIRQAADVLVKQQLLCAVGERSMPTTISTIAV